MQFKLVFISISSSSFEVVVVLVAGGREIIERLHDFVDTMRIATVYNRLGLHLHKQSDSILAKIILQSTHVRWLWPICSNSFAHPDPQRIG